MGYHEPMLAQTLVVPWVSWAHHWRTVLTVDVEGAGTVGVAATHTKGMEVGVLMWMQGMSCAHRCHWVIRVVPMMRAGPVRAVPVDRVPALAQLGRGHPLLLLPPVAEPDPHDLLLQL